MQCTTAFMVCWGQVDTVQCCVIPARFVPLAVCVRHISRTDLIVLYSTDVAVSIAACSLSLYNHLSLALQSDQCVSSATGPHAD
jgi:hypothetical protein